MIALLVIQLFFDPVVVEVVFIEHISHQASQPVRCDFKSQPMQPHSMSVFAEETLFGRASKHVSLRPSISKLVKLGKDLDRFWRYGHNMFPFALHPHARDYPQSTLEIDFVPLSCSYRCVAQADNTP